MMNTVEVNITLSKTPPRPPLINARAAVAGVAVERALGVAGRRRLQNGRGEALILRVPAREWVQPIMAALRTIVRNSTLVVDGKKSEEVANALAGGKNVVGVSPNPRAILSRLLLETASEIEIPPPDAELVRNAMRRCLVGRLPAAARTLAVAHIDFDQLCAAMSTGLTKRQAVERLQRIAPTPPTRHRLKLPLLADAIEYGEARLWGLELAEDIADYKAGKIGWRDVSVGAIWFSEPGIGKSTLAAILAEACEVPLVSGSVSALFGTTEGHLGDVVKGVRRLFDEARAKSPCLLFLDEISSLADETRLSRSYNADFWRVLTTEFYLQLDSAMHDREGVVVIGAANEPRFSAALVRPGRLERVIKIERPSPPGLANILRTLLENDLEGVDLMPLVTAAPPATAAIAMDWVRAARRRARRANRALVLEDLENQILARGDRTEAEIWRAAGGKPR